VARTLHAWSLRASGPFVILPAATLAPDRLEEQLFGIEDRAGGTVRIGALEEAHGGTLLIDEIADMPLETQGKVLRVLVDQTFLRVDGAKKVKVDVRVVTSTSRDLEALIAQGLFREDLFHRSPWCRSGCRRWWSGARTSPNWWATSCSSTPR
jgi:two-component system, NtrC family, nitrogen regulation response regulator NtrX